MPEQNQGVNQLENQGVSQLDLVAGVEGIINFHYKIKGSASLIWLQELRASLLSITRFKQAVIGASY